MPKFSPGELLFVTVSDQGMTLVVKNKSTSGEIKEYFHQHPLSRYPEPQHKSLGYSSCLIQAIKRNKLGQAIDYGLLINGVHYTCKAILAERYLFKL